MATHVLLNELKQPVTLEDVSVPAGKPRSHEFLEINPRGNVPVLVDGDLILREGAAILLYLLEKHKSPLLPKDSVKRAKAIEMLMFANASLHPAYGKAFFVLRTLSNETSKKEAFAAVLEQINKFWKDLDTTLADSKFTCGEEMTVADILITVIANWGITGFPESPTLGENVKRMIKEVIALPSYQKALQEEKVEYKAAA